MPSAEIAVEITLTNPKALRALRYLANSLNELYDDFSYRPEIRKAANAAKYLFNNLRVVSQEDKDGA